MSSTRKATRFLIALLAVIVVSFLAWTILQRRTNSLQLPAMPAATSEVEFILKYPSKTFWGNYVVVSAEANPGTNCKLTYISPAGVFHEIETVANDSGLCEGRWKIEEAEGKGTGRVNFTIGDRSETHFIEVLSSF